MLRDSTSMGWTNFMAKTKMSEWGKQVASAHDTEQQSGSQGPSGLMPPRLECPGELFHRHGVKEVPSYTSNNDFRLHIETVFFFLLDPKEAQSQSVLTD